MLAPSRQLTVLAGLVVICALVYGRALRRPNGPVRKTEPKEAMAALVAEASTSVRAQPQIASRQAQRASAASLSWKRDPFTLGSSAEEALGLTLVGIVWEAAHPMAMINGVPVVVGDEIEGYRVVQILQDRVTVVDDTGTYQLQLSP